MNDFPHCIRMQPSWLRRGAVLAGLLWVASNAWALKVPIKCGETLVGNIDVSVSADKSGVSGGFTSVVGGPPPTLSAAAKACDEDHWNWFQVVTADNQVPPEVPGGKVPYVDPPKGGIDNQWADDLPWYYDEKPVPDKLPPGKDKAESEKYQLSKQTKDPTLSYSDFPGGGNGLKLSFNTYLVSLNKDSSLHSFHEGFSWDFSIDDMGTGTANNLQALLNRPGDKLYKDIIGGFATAVPEPQAVSQGLAGLLMLMVWGLSRRPARDLPCHCQA